jgi:hypothetical protein
MKNIRLNFKFSIITFILISLCGCAISPKTKCIRDKKGESCLAAAKSVIKTVDRKDKEEVKEKVAEAAGWYKFGCRYNHGESCYLLGRYLIRKNKISGRKLVRRACQLGFKKACN